MLPNVCIYLLCRNCVRRIAFIAQGSEDFRIFSSYVSFHDSAHPWLLWFQALYINISKGSTFREAKNSMPFATWKLKQIKSSSVRTLLYKSSDSAKIKRLQWVWAPFPQPTVFSNPLGALDTCQVNQIGWHGNNSRRETVNLCSPTKEIIPTIRPVKSVSLPTCSVVKTSSAEIKNNLELFMSFIWQVKCGLCVLMMEELTRSPSTLPAE